MMDWEGGGMSGWGWFGMSVGMLVLVVLLVGGGVLLYRALDRPGEPGRPPRQGPPTTGSPEALLAERFARGELDEDEYRARLRALRDGDPPPEPRGTWDGGTEPRGTGAR